MTPFMFSVELHHRIEDVMMFTEVVWADMKIFWKEG